tara:strand:+ start:1422 stop:2576 length:1155 start_codon:yes stop_codon:yes gene_type:complete
MRRVIPILLATTTLPAWAGYDIIDSDGHKLEVGGRVVVQHYDSETTLANGDETSENQTYFRRLRPYIKASINDWKAKLAWELGKGPNSVKDAYIGYDGIKGVEIKLGNETVPFSRERMISSAEQQFAERSLVGENNYGTPSRQPGLHVQTDWKKPVNLYFSLAKASVYADTGTEVRFISPWSHTDIDDALIDDGMLYVGRVDYSLLGKPRYSEALFGDKSELTLSVAAFYWDNDEDNPGFYEDAQGLELAANYQANRLSVSAQYNRIQADAVRLPDANEELSVGIITDGDVELDILALQSGYMVIPKTLQLAAAYETMRSDTDATPSFTSRAVWQENWDRWELGGTWFIDKHDHKLQFSYRDEDGVKGRDRERQSWFVQWQYDY